MVLLAHLTSLVRDVDNENSDMTPRLKLGKTKFWAHLTELKRVKTNSVKENSSSHHDGPKLIWLIVVVVIVAVVVVVVVAVVAVVVVINNSSKK